MEEGEKRGLVSCTGLEERQHKMMCCLALWETQDKKLRGLSFWAHVGRGAGEMIVCHTYRSHLSCDAFLNDAGI